MRYEIADWEVAHQVVRLDVGYPLPESADPVVRLQPDADGNCRIDMDKIMREHLLRPRVPAPAPAPAPAPEMTFAETVELGRRLREKVGRQHPAEPLTVAAPAPTSARDYLTVEEAADRARFKIGTIYNAIYMGTLKKMAGSHQVRIKPAELDRWLAEKRPTRKEAQAAKRKQTDAAARKAAKKKSNGR